MKKLSKVRCFESLENRLPMAGNVSVALEGSLLKVNGDNLANEVTIAQNVAGTIVVRGLNGTSINGLPQVTLRNVALNALDVRMAGGDDRLTINTLRAANDVEVDLGAGNDTVRVAGSNIGANLKVIGLHGIDRANLTGSRVGVDAKIDLGLDRGVANVSSTIIGYNLDVITELANDQVTLNAVTAGGTVTVDTKAGSDAISIVALDALLLGIQTDAGADSVTLQNVRTATDLEINTGVGADTLRMTDVNAGKSIKVSTDADNDTVRATRVRAAEDAVFEGGDGVDRLFGSAQISGGVKKEIKDFEFVL